MRKIWISLIAMSIAMPSTAVIARKGVYNIAQSDGSTISVIKVGDERSHIYMTTDGIPVYRTDSTEDFHYMTPSGRSDIKAHNADRRDYNELSFLRENITDLSAGQILQSRIRLSQRVKTANATSPHKTSEVVNKGKAKIPVLLVQYADKKFIDSDPLATFERFSKTETKVPASILKTNPTDYSNRSLTYTVHIPSLATAPLTEAMIIGATTRGWERWWHKPASDCPGK